MAASAPEVTAADAREGWFSGLSHPDKIAELLEEAVPDFAVWVR